MTEAISLFAATMEYAAGAVRWYMAHLQQIVGWALVADVLAWTTFGIIQLVRVRRRSASGQARLAGITGI